MENMFIGYDFALNDTDKSVFCIIKREGDVLTIVNQGVLTGKRPVELAEEIQQLKARYKAEDLNENISRMHGSVRRYFQPANQSAPELQYCNRNEHNPDIDFMDIP